MIDKTSSQFKRGVREEAKEHPHFTKKEIEQLVVDHLNLHKYMYRK
jgi:hypothetical protein